MINHGLWESQKVIYDNLSNDSIFMNLINDKLFDEQQTNQDYTYVCISDDVEEITDNTLNRLGFETIIRLSIYTKPYGLGWSTCYSILNEMNRLLNEKRLEMDNLSKLWIMNINVTHYKNKDKRILHCDYKVWSQQTD